MGVRMPRVGPAAAAAGGPAPVAPPTLPQAPLQQPEAEEEEEAPVAWQVPEDAAVAAATAAVAGLAVAESRTGGDSPGGSSSSAGAGVQVQGLGGLRYTHLILDCDGVLVDTERASCEALRLAILEVTGFDIPHHFPDDYRVGGCGATALGQYAPVYIYMTLARSYGARLMAPTERPAATAMLGPCCCHGACKPHHHSAARAAARMSTHLCGGVFGCRRRSLAWTCAHA